MPLADRPIRHPQLNNTPAPTAPKPTPAKDINHQPRRSTPDPDHNLNTNLSSLCVNSSDETG
jgi:hypothetical protein